ncbi:MAG TPA: cupredoxin domain-containing protein [Abditibacterium sp.]
MKNFTKIFAAFGAILLAMVPAMASPQLVSGMQKINIALPSGYSTSKRSVKAGKPVALTFFLQSNAGCGNTISFPAAKWQKTLEVGQSATVIYTPKKSGSLTFTCGMNHMKGSIRVK